MSGKRKGPTTEDAWRGTIETEWGPVSVTLDLSGYLERLRPWLARPSTRATCGASFSRARRSSSRQSEEIPAKVAADEAYQNAKKHSDRQNARIEHDKALGRVMTALLADHTELFKQFSDNPGFKKWLSDTIFGMTYEPPADASDLSP